MSGSSVMRPRYFFFWASLPAMMTGDSASVLPSQAVEMPVHAHASSSEMIAPSVTPAPMPPYSSGMCELSRPISQAFFTTSHGYAPACGGEREREAARTV